MSGPKTLKSMSASECSSERSRHRVAIGHLVLLRMQPGKTAAERADIDARMLKLRRRIARLDRRAKQIASRLASMEAEGGWQAMPVIGGA